MGTLTGLRWKNARDCPRRITGPVAYEGTVPMIPFPSVKDERGHWFRGEGTVPDGTLQTITLMSSAICAKSIDSRFCVAQRFALLAIHGNNGSFHAPVM